MVKLIGLGRARDVVLGGADLPAEEACRLGLVTAVVPDEALLEEARARPAAILQRDAQAYGLAKRLLNLAGGVDLYSGIFAEGLAQSGLIHSEEHHQRVRAALVRRRPDHPMRKAEARWRWRSSLRDAARWWTRVPSSPIPRCWSAT
jgi:enoyl-CoA hydratase/carnithine racemase